MDKWKVIVFGGIIIFVVILIAAFLIGRKPAVKKVTLEFWGTLDEKDAWSETLSSFNSQFPHIKINYTKKSPVNFEREWLEALATGKGPDIFTLPHHWLAIHQNKLSSLPLEIMNFQTFQDNFVDVTIKDFSKDQKNYALPLFVDTLALYYNKDLFNKIGIAQPPTTWDEFLKDVALFTIRSQAGDILQSGAALGTANNVEKASDLLALLMLQSGIDILNLDKEDQREKVEKALTFYTQFAQPKEKLYTWNNNFPNSLEYFAQGKVAMMFHYSSAREKIINKNPNLNFSIAPLPQLKDAEKFINYADYWGLAVPLQSRNQFESWQFIKFVTDPTPLYAYLQKTKRPTPRYDLVEFQKQDSDLKSFALQSLSAVSWYQTDKPAIDRIFEEMIESVLGRLPVQEAIKSAAKKLNQLTK